MADALISIVLDRLTVLAEEKIRDHVKLLVGVEEEIESLKNTLRSIQDFVEDAERKQVEEKSVQRWLEELKDVAYQIDDVVDEWITSLLRFQLESAETSTSTSTKKKKKVSGCLPSPSFCFKQVTSRHAIALKIQRINQQLDTIYRKRDMLKVPLTKIERPQHLITISVIDVSEVCGRETDQNTIVGHLLGGEGEQISGLSIVSIVGTGGMGKTTLAQLAYNHSDVKAHFNQSIWVCVSDPFEPTRIFRHIVEILEKKSPNLHSLEALQQMVQKCISRKKFLLVLDDVWTENSELWKQVKNTLSSGARGSRILVTTRMDTVASMMKSTHTHLLGGLSQQQSRALFSQLAFYGKTPEEEEALKAIGEKIADRCKGLPLAIKTLGNLMRLKNGIKQWEAVMNHEVWELDVFEKDIFPPLWLSYYDLPYAIKRCFSFCAAFPKDHEFKRDELIHMWMAHNYLGCGDGSKEMEMVGIDYFEYLAARSFFQDFQKDDDGTIFECKMHDIVHDFAQSLTKNECVVIESDNQKQRSIIENCRHASLIVQKDVEEIVSSSFLKNLHTLWLSNKDCYEFIPPSFQHLTCLRVLKWESVRDKLPEEVGKLIHLRYLDLSRCLFLRELPETICNLYNLQTLSIEGCRNLVKLPKAMVKLSNLRHLENDSTDLESLPKGIARLSSLQTLNQFPISNGGDDECKITDLRNLSKLKGSLRILCLNKVEDAREAKEAELEKMIGINILYLMFKSKSNKVVADALKPPPKLETLEIEEYADVELPSWLTNSSLTHLKSLTVRTLTECSCMPPLGELTALEYLYIYRMDSLEYIGDEFLGLSSPTVFPRLKQLIFGGMKNLKKWEVKEEEERLVMPSLRVLKMYGCPKLEGLPNHILQRTSLQELHIENCPIMKQCYEKDGRTSHIPTTIFK